MELESESLVNMPLINEALSKSVARQKLLSEDDSTNLNGAAKRVWLDIRGTERRNSLASIWLVGRSTGSYTPASFCAN